MRAHERTHLDERRARRGVVQPTRAGTMASAAATVLIGRGHSAPPAPTPRSLLYLQRQAGNAAVTTLVQRKSAAGTTCGGPGRCACATCGDEWDVQRDPTISRAPEPAPVPADYRVRHKRSGQRFTDDPVEVRKALELFMATQPDMKALDWFNHDDDFVGPVPGHSLALTCDLDPAACTKYRADVMRVVRAEVTDLRSRMNSFKADFQQRANDTVLLLLNDSEEKINSEKKRYGLDKKATWWGLSADYSMNDPKDLTDAAKALLEKYLALKTATDAMKKITELGGSGTPGRPALPPGGTDAMGTAEDRARAEAEVKAREKDYSLLRKEKESEHPLLITYDLRPTNERTHGVLAGLAADSSDTKAELLYEHIDVKLKNIKTTRDHVLGHKDAVWKLPTVLGITQKLPDIASYDKLPTKQLQQIAIEDAKSQVSLEALIETAALAAISVGLGMVATPLAAAGMRALAGAALVTDASITVAQTLSAIHQFEFEQAATNTDLDGQARSISQEEPSLFWLALDVLTTGLQLKDAAREFRGLVQLWRGATAAKAAKNEAEAAKLIDDLKKKADDLKLDKEVGEKLGRDVAKFGASTEHDAGEIAANLEKIVTSRHPDYTHQIAMGGERFWRRTAQGHWCFFASPPRCGLVIDRLVTGTPSLSKISLETFAVLMDHPAVLKLAKADARVGKLLEKYGGKGVRTLRHAPYHGELPVELLERFDRLSDIPGADRLLVDLAAGESTTKGAIGELHYIEMLLKKGEQIERIADINVKTGKKAADIVLKSRKKVVDVKYWDWTQRFWRKPENVTDVAEELRRQVLRRKEEYPGSPILYVFAGQKKDIPQPIVKALTEAGAKVEGTF